jgi:hypothetical protein
MSSTCQQLAQSDTGHLKFLTNRGEGMQVQQLYMADCLQIVEDEVVLQSKEDVDVSQG